MAKSSDFHPQRCIYHSENIYYSHRSYIEPPRTLLNDKIILQTALQINVGKQDKYGVCPNRPILTEHPTISQDLLNKVGHGKSKLSNIKNWMANRVFEDGTEETFDVLICVQVIILLFRLMNFMNQMITKYHYTIKVVHPNMKIYFSGTHTTFRGYNAFVGSTGKMDSRHLNAQIKLPSKDKMLQTINTTAMKCATFITLHDIPYR